MRERKLIQTMRERHVGDRNTQFAGVGEIREALPTWWMFLREVSFALATAGSAPLSHPALQRTQRTWPVLSGIVALQLFEQRHGAQMRALPQQRQQFAFPNGSQRIRACPPLARRTLRRQRIG